MAQTMADEEKKQKAAKATMIFATEYKIEDYVRYPIMQAKFKDNIEAQSKGQIYVKLHPAGQLGIGAALAQKVQAGTVQGGGVSLSNFSPYAPVVDLINIPYWCGDNQRFANLVTSKAWNDEITPKVNAKGYQPLFYFTVDPRTVASRKGFKVIKVPADMQGMKMRVPPSKLLQTFYRLTGANPTVVPWGETATAIKQGVADGLDPAIAALATFGFQDLLSQHLVRALGARRADVRRQRGVVPATAGRPAQGHRRRQRADADRDLRADRAGAHRVDAPAARRRLRVLQPQRRRDEAVGRDLRRAAQGIRRVQGPVRRIDGRLRRVQEGRQHAGADHGA